MRVATEAGEEAVHLVVNHRVTGHGRVELGLLLGGGQFPVEQQVAGLKEVAAFGELLDGVTPIEQDAFVTVDIGDLAFAGRVEVKPGS